MKKIALCLAAAATLAAAAPAMAQNYGYGGGYGSGNGYGWDNNGRWNNGGREWMSINQRQAMLDRRIDQGVRSGQLTRAEAYRLRSEFRQIARLEASYRRDGLQNWERADLDRRFDRLAFEIRDQRRDFERDRRYSYNYR